MSDYIKRKLLWASRRGMLELDLLLEPFSRERASQLGEADLAAYRRLLECEDGKIYAWLMGRESAGDFEGIIRILRDYNGEKSRGGKSG